MRGGSFGAHDIDFLEAFGGKLACSFGFLMGFARTVEAGQQAREFSRESGILRELLFALPQSRDRLFKAVHIRQDTGETMVGEFGVGIKLKGFLKLSQRILFLTEAEERLAQEKMSVGMIRIDGDFGSELLRRLCVVGGKEIEIAETIVGVHHIGLA